MMNLKIEVTISASELEIINLLIALLKTKVFKITFIPGGFVLISYDGTWQDNLEFLIKAVNYDLKVELVDGIKSPSFKKVVVTGFPRLFD